MRTLQIHDLEPQHAAVVDPRLVLPMLGERAIRASWQVAGVARFDEPFFATGEGATHLEALCQSLKRVSGVVLSQIFGRVRQVIWGEFSAYDGDGTPWVILRAIDSSWCEVETDDVGILDRVRETFADVQTVP
ncbi:hypothetical protein G3T14_14290 [Methylobacterium sp. BTF04]|uniref:hypothetical protein n=1 Tax=Methylobacterium sp. BTF04 TaxID=2708300 RepID=UPI0013D135F7|nr:hypothetical protein [Methylobacterium sp. BTF04]NEU13291.1 hypothetical protein [Methylobacterium sp. BTF04]